MPATILAAGGLVWRGSSRSPEIAVIHRPHRHDWSLPKGKLNRLEAAPAAAVREVIEETGLAVTLQHQLGSTRYRVDGVPKTVHYWAMRYDGGTFTANDEADELRWLTPRDAARKLDFPADRVMVTRFAASRAPDTAVLLIRHAKAGKRADWKGDDNLRPLDGDGRRQAAAIASFASLFAPVVITAATPLRCQQTVLPLAEKFNLPIGEAAAFSDKSFQKRPASSARALRSLSRSRQVVAVTSQGGAIPGLLAQVDPSHVPHSSRKGSVWALFYARGELVKADYYDRP